MDDLCEYPASWRTFTGLSGTDWRGGARQALLCVQVGDTRRPAKPVTLCHQLQAESNLKPAINLNLFLCPRLPALLHRSSPGYHMLLLGP
jgi:hypothetical protein